MPYRPPIFRPLHPRIRRPSAHQAGYGAAWRKLRRMVLAERPLCADPFGTHARHGEVMTATEVDHILPRADRGTDALENLHPLSCACHSRKTALEDGGFGSGGSLRPPSTCPGRRKNADFEVHSRCLLAAVRTGGLD